MRTSMSTLQKLIYERLKSIKTVITYDKVPKEAKMPFIVLGDAESFPWGTKLQKGEEINFDIHVFSEYPSRKEVLDVVDLVLEALSKEEFDLGDNYELVLHSTVGWDIRREDKIYHALIPAKFRVLEKEEV